MLLFLNKKRDCVGASEHFSEPQTWRSWVESNELSSCPELEGILTPVVGTDTWHGLIHFTDSSSGKRFKFPNCHHRFCRANQLHLVADFKMAKIGLQSG